MLNAILSMEEGALYATYKRAEQNIRHLSDASVPMRADKESIAEYQKQYRAALAPETLRHLDQAQKQFLQWCRENELPDTVPISPVQVAKYVESLGGKVSLQTIKNRVWAIGELHNSKFLPSPSKHRLVVLSVRATQRRYGSRVKQAPALCKSDVIAISNRLGDTPIDVRDRALILAASDTWCRASELVAFRVSDVEQHADGSGTVHLLNSKHDPYGRGEHGYLSKFAMDAISKLVVTFEKGPNDYLFTSMRGITPNCPIVPTTVSRVFKKLTGRQDISAHSTRIGGVHDALRLGCDLVQIMTSGRWASPEMPAVYGRKLLASKSAAADVCRAYEDLHQARV